MNECEERCEEQFGQCVKHGDNMGGMQCLAHRQYCLNGCATEQFPDAGSGGGYGGGYGQCSMSGCPTCASDYSLSNPCAYSEGHGGDHACSYSHTWA
ncbi:MAG TPA: hypothetical protein VLJ59_13045 [Mycobacteriales bacterium]|nr:hypothetical protein [Mycobacteriales bacterium]